MRFYSAVLSKNIILRIQKLGRIGGELYTLLLRSFERKHVHWADNVYASVQKASAKTSFCVYRSWGVCERCCIRFRAEVLGENIILRIQMLGRIGGELYTLLLRSFERKHVHWADNVYASAQESSAKTSFCVYRSWGVCEGQCVRICAGVLSKSIILRIQKPARLRGAMYTLLRRSPQRKHHFAYTEACASARGAVYASA